MANLHFQTMEEKYGLPFCRWVQYHAQERLYTCHFYAIFAGPRFVEIQKYCFLPWQRDVTTSLSIRKETCLPLVRLLRFSLNKFSVIYNYQNYWGWGQNMDQGSMAPHFGPGPNGPLSYGPGPRTLSLPRRHWKLITMMHFRFARAGKRDNI